MSLSADLAARLQDLHSRTAETPLFNPVFQLGLELSRQLESGDLSLDQVEKLVAELECEGLRAPRAPAPGQGPGPAPCGNPRGCHSICFVA
mgnify:CR=1 FL=1